MKKKMKKIISMLLALGTVALYSRVLPGVERVACTGDAMISEYPAERPMNTGGRTHLRVKRGESYAIFKFDLSGFRGRAATGGRLHLVSAGGGDLTVDQVSTIAVDWEEGTGNWDKNLKGGANFEYAVFDSKRWKAGGNFLSVTFGQGGSILNSKGGVIPDKGVGMIELDAAFVMALIDGSQYGIAIAAAKNANTDIYSREQTSSQPYLEVFFGDKPKSWTKYVPKKVDEDNWDHPVTCRAIADTNVMSSGGERDWNAGGRPNLKLKGTEDQALLKFDVSGIRRMTINKARLYFKKTDNTHLITLGVSTIASDWVEGSSNETIERGASCFNYRTYPVDEANPAPDDFWAGPDSNFLDVAQGEGYTISCYGNVMDGRKNGWICVDVDPWVVQDLIAHEQYGLLVSEEKGQRAFVNFMMDDGVHPNTNPNYWVQSRDRKDGAPYLIVSGTVSDTTPPAPIEGPVTASNTDNGRRMEPGQVKLFWTASGDDGTIGRAYAYDIRYGVHPLNAGNWEAAEELPRFQVIRPGEPGTKETLWIDILEPGTKYYFAIRVLDEVGNASAPVFAEATATDVEAVSIQPAPEAVIRTGSPANGDGLTVWAFPDTCKVSPVTLGMLKDGTYRTGPSSARNGNIVWDGAAKRVKLAGCSNEFVAFQLCIEPDDPAVSRSVEITVGDIGPVGRRNIKVFREWCVYMQAKDGTRTYYPDPLLPLDGTLTIPNPNTGDPKTTNTIPGQKAGLAFVDVYIPHGTKPGVYQGEIKVDKLSIPVALTVYDFELPDTINSIIFEMNNYSGWRGRYGKLKPEQLNELEWNYHRLAHAHRLTWNSVTYGHTMSYQKDAVPPLKGKGKDMRVADWSAWDRRYGPLFDGSAFTDNPRAGVPVTHIYLPFFENWPSKIHQHFHYDIAKDMLGGFDSVYEDEIKAISGQFMVHFNEKGWTKTQFMFFLNNKNYYFEPLKNRMGTYWLLDEPMHRDDYLALNYYANLFREGARSHKGEVRVGFRADVSRPQWMRDYLDSTLDYFCGSYRPGFYKKHVDRQKRRHDETFSGPRQIWVYGGANRQDSPNLAMPAWIMKSYLMGVQGMLPWQNEGDSWEKAEPTCVVYAGKRFGTLGPYPSLRMKAMRRGQQDTEYVNLLEKKIGCLRSTTRREIEKFVNFDSRLIKTFAEDAGTEQFVTLDAASFDRLRRTVVDQIGKVKPVPALAPDVGIQTPPSKHGKFRTADALAGKDIDSAEPAETEIASGSETSRQWTGVIGPIFGLIVGGLLLGALVLVVRMKTKRKAVPESDGDSRSGSCGTRGARRAKSSRRRRR